MDFRPSLPKIETILRNVRTIVENRTWQCRRDLTSAHHTFASAHRGSARANGACARVHVSPVHARVCHQCVHVRACAGRACEYVRMPGKEWVVRICCEHNSSTIEKRTMLMLCVNSTMEKRHTMERRHTKSVRTCKARKSKERCRGIGE